MRGGRGPGESMSRPGGSRDDLPTLRVTNISEDMQENDLRDLFSAFGRVARVYVGRDRETGAGKGFAFVSFEDKSTAQKAMEKMHGRGYDNLILNIQWSRTCTSSVQFSLDVGGVCVCVCECGSRGAAFPGKAVRQRTVRSSDTVPSDAAMTSCGPARQSSVWH